MMPENGQLSVPPGFRFHPTDEELIYYYLKKKVSYEAIDLDVIREVDLNKLEPWDLKDKCRIGSGPQNDWYFFSHKDKKYPTGTRTNRATAAGFWKATGRDKAIYYGNAKRIGMRKTLVFYTGRAPHGQKTDWIMHEYRLEDDNHHLQHEDGWVVCRVFKKKNPGRGIQPELHQEDDHYNSHSSFTSDDHHHFMKPNGNASPLSQLPPRQHSYIQPMMLTNNHSYTFDGAMHLPQLSSPDSVAANGSLIHSTMDNLLRLTSPGSGGSILTTQPLLGGGGERLINGGEFGFLDKLLASYQSLDQHQQVASENKLVTVADHDIGGQSSASPLEVPPKFPFQCLGFESDLLKFSK